MKKELIIVGAGGWGREVLTQLQGDPDYNVQWFVKGFLDSRINILANFNWVHVPILGDPMLHQPQTNEIYVCALGDPRKRFHFVQPLLRKSASFIKINTGTYINPGVKIGCGCIISPRVHISPDVDIGQFTTIHAQSIIGHDVSIGSYSQISALVFIGGGVKIGSFVTVHPHSTIIPGIRIGEGSTVGAGSVVVRDVPSGVTVMGNPAKIIFHSVIK